MKLRWWRRQRRIEVPVLYPQDADEQARYIRRIHLQPEDVDMLRRSINLCAARESERRQANRRRLLEGRPAWNFDQARPVPSCGNPPIG